MTEPAAQSFALINLDDAPKRGDSHGQHFAYEMAILSRTVGGRDIAANVTRVPPGKTAFPAHHHFAQEEHFFILSGNGLVRIGDQTHPVKANDYLVHLPGGPETAHQLINTGEEDLFYLAISTTQIPEVVGYPDSGKTGVRYQDHPAPRFLVEDQNKDTVGYWDGESGAQMAAHLRRDGST